MILSNFNEIESLNVCNYLTDYMPMGKGKASQSHCSLAQRWQGRPCMIKSPWPISRENLKVKNIGIDLDFRKKMVLFCRRKIKQGFFRSELLVILQYFFISLNYFFFNFFLESFNLQRPLLMIALYHQTKTPISFWYRWGLNPRSLIQPSEILPIKLTRTHISLNVKMPINVIIIFYLPKC